MNVYIYIYIKRIIYNPNQSLDKKTALLFQHYAIIPDLCVHGKFEILDCGCVVITIVGFSDS